MMSNLNVKPVVLFMACLCLLMALSCVSASEISDMDSVTAIDDTVSSDASVSPLDQVDDEEVVIPSDQADDGVAGNDIESDVGTFNDLVKEIENLKPGDEYYITKDYAFNEETDGGNPIIDISVEDVRIHGNFHTIDAKGADLAKFTVSGYHVFLYDIIFKNFKSTDSSHIVWSGDNGYMFSCDFYNNTAPNGGSLTWSGNQGYMSYCLFENTCALNRGGALYVTGDNLLIDGATFKNFTSQLSNEAIYFSNEKAHVLNIKNSWFANNQMGEMPVKVLWDEGCTVFLNGFNLTLETFDSLCNDIENLKPGDYYILDKDYVVANPKGDLARNRIINIAVDNVTIDGNGHKIDGGGASVFFALFNITGNNVRILNLNIVNFRAYDSQYINSNKNIYGDNYNPLRSPIEWLGDNGFISNCLFYDNVGYEGGAIYWAGNNGKIENCIFDDNAANFGGSIFIAGNNNLIKDCILNNSYATNHYEAIYFKNNNNPKLTINNCTFESERQSGKTVLAENGCEVIYDGFIPKNILPPMDFNELREILEQLKDGDTFTFDRDCLFEVYDGDLTINASNITINGNGYKIYGNDSLSCLFNIFGDNVRIIGLTFDFISMQHECQSFITLNGNNGALVNCTFIGSKVSNGGVVNWNGDDGLIDNCVFINNSARAISVDGTKNIIRNCVFNNTYAMSHNNEIIYFIYRNLDNRGTLTIDNCSFESDNGVKIWIEDDSEVIIDGKSVPVTIDELYDELANLKAGEVYDIYRHYYSPSKSFVISQDNITINANGHTIHVYEGTLNESIFFVNGSNVNINGLTIFDKDNLRNGSLITWNGDNGVLSNCKLIGNIAEFGGALTWMGDNGLVDCNEFKDNSAIYAGGAIFIGGVNNKISNCLFTNSGSKLADEAIYIDSTRKNFSLENALFVNCHTLIDGFVNSIDLGYLTTYECVLNIADEYLNIYPLIYAANMKGDTCYYNDNISYYCRYNEVSGEFVLTIVKEFRDLNISYSKDFVFNNIFNCTLSDIFNKLSAGAFENRFTIIKTEKVGSVSDYMDVMNNKLYSLDIPSSIMDILNKDMENSNKTKEGSLNYILNVIFTKTLTIDCDKTWKLSSSPFDSVNIDGKGSVIRGSFKDRDEDKWVTLGEGDVFSANNIRIEGFNTAIENMGGLCTLVNVTFYKNVMDYWIDRDWGAAILNTGIVTCINCTFIENSAKNGGAIFNQGLLIIEKSHFYNNSAYGEGPSICVGDGGMVIYDGVNITENDQVKTVHFAKSMSLAESTIISIFAPVVATVVGVVVGFLTANAFAGLAVGLALGAAIGAGAASWIISENYDVEYNRLETVLTLSITSAVAGAVGGYFGGMCGDAFFLHVGLLTSDPIYMQLTTLGHVMSFVWKEQIATGTLLLILGQDAGLTGMVAGISYYFTND